MRDASFRFILFCSKTGDFSVHYRWLSAFSFCWNFVANIINLHFIFRAFIFLIAFGTGDKRSKDFLSIANGHSVRSTLILNIVYLHQNKNPSRSFRIQCYVFKYYFPNTHLSRDNPLVLFGKLIKTKPFRIQSNSSVSYQNL